MPTSVLEEAVEAARAAMGCVPAMLKVALAVALPAIEDSCRKRFEEEMLSDPAIRAVTEVLDEEFAAETGGQAITDYAHAKRFLDAALKATREGGS